MVADVHPLHQAPQHIRSVFRLWGSRRRWAAARAATRDDYRQRPAGAESRRRGVAATSTRERRPLALPRPTTRPTQSEDSRARTPASTVSPQIVLSAPARETPVRDPQPRRALGRPRRAPIPRTPGTPQRTRGLQRLTRPSHHPAPTCGSPRHSAPPYRATGLCPGEATKPRCCRRRASSPASDAQSARLPRRPLQA